MFDSDSEEYKEIDYRIKCIQFYQQECIDSAKNGKPPRPIPSYWHNYNDSKLEYNTDKETGEILNTEGEMENIELLRNTLTEKKPYYFRYIYKDVNKEYIDFIENMEVNSLRNFRKTTEELKSTKNKTEKEIKFLDWYERNLPLSDNPCVINKIAHKVETSFSGDFQLQKNTVSNFDYELYMSDEEGFATKTEVRKIVELYKDFSAMNRNQRIKVDYTNKEELIKSNDDRYTEMKLKLLDMIPNDDILLNTMINLSYKSKKISKSFVWSLMGDKIIENLLEKSSYTIKYPTQDVNGDISYSGMKFKMVSKNLKEVCND